MKPYRQSIIRDLVERESITSQEQLRARLRERGIARLVDVRAADPAVLREAVGSGADALAAIPAHDVDVCRHPRCVRIASHRTKLGARGDQLIDDSVRGRLERLRRSLTTP